jgi:hypothetical protein
MSIKPDFWSGSAIYHKGEKISIGKAINIAEKNAAVIKKLKIARTNRTIGTIIAHPGAFAFGYVLGQTIANNPANRKPNWTVGGVGAGLMVGGMILQGIGNKKLKEAVHLYNSTLVNNSKTIAPELNLVYSENGLGVSVRF